MKRCAMACVCSPTSRATRRLSAAVGYTTRQPGKTSKLVTCGIGSNGVDNTLVPCRQKNSTRLHELHAQYSAIVCEEEQHRRIGWDNESNNVTPQDGDRLTLDLGEQVVADDNLPTLCLTWPARTPWFPRRP